MTKIVVVVNQKGGVGKSSTAATAAFYASQRLNKKVCVVDMDATQRIQSLLFADDYTDKNTLSHFYRNSELNPVVSRFHNIHVLCASPDLDDFNHKMDAELLFALRDKAEQFEQHGYDYVFFDCPPTQCKLTDIAMIGADSVVVPTELTDFSVKGVNDFLDQIKGIQRRFNADLRVAGVLPNLVDTRIKEHKDRLELLKKSLGTLMMDNYLPRRASYQISIANPVPTWESAKDANAKAAAEIMLKCMGELFERIG